jgi:hypothetical protein
VDAAIGKAVRIEASELFSGEGSYLLLDAGDILVLEAELALELSKERLYSEFLVDDGGK